MSQPDQEATPPPGQSVVVAGSCMTRDAFNGRFNPTWRSFYDVPLSSNQTSVVSLMSPPVTDPFTPTREMSAYDTWNVGSDLTRELLRLLPEVQPDVVVVDFFADVWFGVAELPDGRFVTDNRWKLHHTDLYQDRAARGELVVHRHEDDPDAYFELWAESLDRFASFLRTESPGSRVVLHRGWLTDRVMVPGRPRPQPLHRHTSVQRVDVPRLRDFWARLDDHALAAHGWDCLDLRDLRTPTHVDHAWGPFYVHYLDEYYHAFLVELLRLTRHDDLAPTTRALVDLAAAAAAEPWQRRFETQRAVVERQQSELASLRSQAGPSTARRAARRALAVVRAGRRR